MSNFLTISCNFFLKVALVDGISHIDIHIFQARAFIFIDISAYFCVVSLILA